MISVAEAQAHCLSLVRPLGTEDIPLRKAAGRILAAPATASRDQPPFAASAMDGYAVPAQTVAPGDSFRVVGEAAAGHQWHGRLNAGEALRIFTGAPLPEGAGRIVIQEDVSRDGDTIIVGDSADAAPYIRPAGMDFPRGFTLDPPRRLSPADLALLAAMNVPRVRVRRKPIVAIIATGDELVLPGDDPRPDQIVASNIYALEAMLDAEGATPRLLPIARDTVASLQTILGMATDADLIVTIGGASVGDHDLVAQAAEGMGLERSFYKIAMRPGKPLMAGRMGSAALLGLPGNPVSAIVCGHVFLLPMIRAMQGLPDPLPRPMTAPLAAPVEANGLRAHYMRARREADGLRVLPRQDSALLAVLADAQALVVRPPGAPAAVTGESVTFLPL